MTLVRMLTGAALSRPTAPSTRFADRKRTWAETEARVARLAAAFRQELGIGTGDRVAILSMNSDRFTETYFATWWAGAVTVPMNVRWSAAENAYSLKDSGARVLLVDQAFAPIVDAIREDAKDIAHIVYLGDDAVPAGMHAYEDLIAGHDAIDAIETPVDDLAGLYYTGGTTGFPKGVMLSHGAFWYNFMVCAKYLNLYPGDTYLHAAPMFHVADMAGGGAASMAGVEHVYLPSFEPGAAFEMLADHGVTHAVMVPTMIAMLLQHPSFDPSRLSQLRSIIYGGSPMPEGVLRDLLERLPHIDVVQAYGQTELAPMITVLSPDYHALDGPKAGKLQSAGQPVIGCEVRIVDEDGSDVPNGEVGEVVARSPGVMDGYWNRPEQTAETLKDGWVFTGDGGYRDPDGFLFIVDRLKDMIVTGGENVFSAEVESAISTHAGVAQVAVIGIPSDEWGEAVHAIIVPAGDAAPSEDDIITHCRGQIANYKLPRSVSVHAEPLPLSGAGKVLKRTLREPFWAGKGRQVS